LATREQLDVDSHLVVDHRRLWRADLSHLRLDGFSANASSFRRCRFEDTVIESASFGEGRDPTLYYKCSFDGSRIAAPVPGRARFVACSFRDVRLNHWFCDAAEFVYCVFSGEAEESVFDARLSEQDAAELGRERNEYQGNDFRGMDFRDVAFRGGIDLSQQALPSAEDYVFLPDAASALRHVADHVAGWADDARRQSALSLLEVFGADVEGGQRQLLLRRSDFVRHHDADLVGDLFGALQRVARL
jgi:hypothetical protein